MFYLLLFLFFSVSTLLTYFYLSLASKKNWVDIPNQRSSHAVTTPRGGGVVFVSLWLFSAIVGLFFYTQNIVQIMALILGAIIVSMTAFYDDRVSLSAKYRILAYFIGALIVVIGLHGFAQLQLGSFILPLGWFGSLLAILAIVWSINLFNFMDGIDGIAGVEALFVLGVGGFFLWQAGGHDLAILAWTLIALVSGFLVWNKPPAKLFMGDVGSATLGFIIIGLALLGEKLYGVPLLLWLILYGVFWFDTTLTLMRRLYAGEKWYEAHRLHAYQRLHQAGWSHARVLLLVIGQNTCLVLLALMGFYFRHFIPLCFLLALGLLSMGYFWVERKNPMYKQ